MLSATTKHNTERLTSVHLQTVNYNQLWSTRPKKCGEKRVILKMIQPLYFTNSLHGGRGFLLDLSLQPIGIPTFFTMMQGIIQTTGV